MKLLLTSSGLSKRPIGEALQQMVGKPTSECRVGFIPTAANVETGNKDWLINQFNQLQRYGFWHIEIVDFSAAGVDWKSRLGECNILWLSGGNTFHLLNQVRKTGFDKWLKDNLDSKVYVGSSASSILVCPTIAIAGEDVGDDNLPGLTDLRGLNVVDFEIEPHCDSSRFEAAKGYSNSTPNPVYALDDLSAIQVVNDEVKVISGGTWKCYHSGKLERDT